MIGKEGPMAEEYTGEAYCVKCKEKRERVAARRWRLHSSATYGGLGEINYDTLGPGY